MAEQAELLPTQTDRIAAAEIATALGRGFTASEIIARRADDCIAVLVVARHRLRHSTDFSRGLEAGAAIAEKWRDENKAAAVKERKRAIFDSGVGMADQLDGAAIECNAIAQAIRNLIPPAKP